MPLNKAQLKTQLEQILNAPQTESNVAAVAAAMADAVDDYVKGALLFIPVDWLHLLAAAPLLECLTVI